MLFSTSCYVDFHYYINNAEIIIFEGIFLLQKRFNFDFRIWVECSYETALTRALKRNQEGLSENRLRKDYRTIYFAAQKIHQAQDQPQAHCDYIYDNETHSVR